MSWRTVVITSRCKLDYKMGFMVVRAEETKKIFIDETDKSNLEKVFAYMELVRELDRDRLFIMVNMRSYFDDGEMETFAESVCLHGFKVLLIESTAQARLKNVERYTIDEDLCEF